MTYERIKTGTFRVSVFLTFLIETLAYLGKSQYTSYTKILGIKIHMEEAVWGTPVLIWGTYFFSLWIAKGFIGKE